MSTPAPGAPPATATHDHPFLATWLWTGGFVLVAAGLLAHRMWADLPWERFALSLVLALAAAALAWPLVRWRRWSWASALAAVWCVALLPFAGPRAVLAVSGLALAAAALGLWLVPRGMPARIAIAAIAGLTVIAGLAGWILHLRVHFATAWIALLALLVVANRRVLAEELRASAAAWRASVAAAPRAMAGAVTLAGLASTGTWLPTMQMDDLAYHLNLPAQLALHARYQAAPEVSVWAFAPWMGDVGQGLAWLLSGVEARSALNAFWLAAAAAALGSAMTALRAAPVERAAAIALFASLPPLVWLAAGMQTELPATAVLLALCAVVVGDARPRLAAGTVLFAALLALKPMHALSALPLLAYAAWRWRGSIPWPRLPLAAVAVFALAGSSYTLSWLHTGNPVLPLFNSVFESPYLPPEDIADARWHAGFGAMLPWRMTFATERYVEAWNGGLGFALIGLAGAWALALFRPGTRALAAAAACVLVLPLLPMQYARYTYPGIALLIVPCLAGSTAMLRDRRVWAWPIVALCVLNLAFQANSGWTHHSAAIKRTVRALGDPAAVYPHYVAERTLIAGLPEDDTGIVLATDPLRGYIAELGGRGRLLSEHAPWLAAARVEADADDSGARWRALFAHTGADWILVTESRASPALRQALDHPDTRHVTSVNGIALWRRAQEPR